jgi:hypothetical protein
LECAKPSKGKGDSPIEDADVIRRDVYAFDQFSMNHLQNVSPSLPGEPLQVHIFVKDPWYKGPLATKDWIGLLMTLLEVCEVYVLWRYNACPLCWISGCNWLYFFAAAAVLLQQRVSREYGKDFDNGRLDILTGQLPTARRKGGERVVLLGAPRNFRHHVLWKIVWTLGSVICPASLIGCYVLLSRANITVTYVWVGFQALWLVLRSIFFHVAQGTNSMVCPILEQRPFEKLPGKLKRRTLDLVFAISKCQMHGHPRGMYSYAEDVASFEQINNFLLRNEPPFDESYPIELFQGVERVPEVLVASVIGDTLLSSAAWFQGSNLSGMDLYDSCVVTFKTRGRFLSIPSARALCGSSTWILGSRNVESGDLARNSPKGTPNLGPRTVKWYYWIPCSDGRWIEVSSEEMKILGKRQVNLLADSEVTERLKSGQLNISIVSVDFIKDIVRLSIMSYQILLDIMT